MSVVRLENEDKRRVIPPALPVGKWVKDDFIIENINIKGEHDILKEKKCYRYCKNPFSKNIFTHFIMYFR